MLRFALGAMLVCACSAQQGPRKNPRGDQWVNSNPRGDLSVNSKAHDDVESSSQPRSDQAAAVFLYLHEIFYLRMAEGESTACVEISRDESRFVAAFQSGDGVTRVSWRYEIVPAGLRLIALTTVDFQGSEGRGVSRACEHLMAVESIDKTGLLTALGYLHGQKASCERDPRAVDLGQCALHLQADSRGGSANHDGPNLDPAAGASGQ